jgi:fructose-1,6-bisphosphatase I
MLVFTWGDGVHMFTLDVDLGEFLLADEHVKMAKENSYYSFNESYAPFVSELSQQRLARIRKRCDKQRWVGSLVADFHRNMLKGGVFIMPGLDISGKKKFKPKLRLNYEAQPIAWLAEQAGGAATDGDNAILDIVPRALHERVAVIVGNKQLIKEIL